jgi:hypothetical protein
MIYYFGTDLQTAGHYLWELDGNGIYRSLHRLEDLPFNPEGLPSKKKGEGMRNGTVRFYRLAHYSICAIEGSCKDGRPGSKSIFYWDEPHSNIGMTALIKQSPIAMKIINQMPFNVEIFKQS